MGSQMRTGGPSDGPEDIFLAFLVFTLGLIMCLIIFGPFVCHLFGVEILDHGMAGK